MAGMDLSVEPYVSDNEADDVQPPSSDVVSMPGLFDKTAASARRFNADSSAEPVVLDPNSSSSSTSPSSLKFLRYRECMRNHAASIGGLANDGCGEFMASARDGTPEALTCAACGCHRNFHRREVSFSTSAGGAPGGPALPLLLHHHAASGVYHHQLSGAPLKSPPPHLQRQMTMVSQNTGPASGGSKWFKQQQQMDSQNDDDDDDDDVVAGGIDDMEADYDRTPERDEVHQQRLHSRIQLGAVAPAMSLSMGAMSGSSGGGSGSGNKRFRTKFTQEQKDRMLDFAEKLGWRLQRHDDASLNLFCAEIGVTRNVFKVWMHNNKNTHGRRGANRDDHLDFTSPPAAPGGPQPSQTLVSAPAQAPQAAGI